MRLAQKQRFEKPNQSPRCLHYKEGFRQQVDFNYFLEKSALAVLRSTVADDLLVLNSPHLLRREEFVKAFTNSFPVWNFDLSATCVQNSLPSVPNSSTDHIFVKILTDPADF